MHKYSGNRIRYEGNSVGTNVNYTDAGYNARSWTQLAPIRVVNNVETGRKCVTRWHRPLDRPLTLSSPWTSSVAAASLDESLLPLVNRKQVYERERKSEVGQGQRPGAYSQRSRSVNPELLLQNETLSRNSHLSRNWLRFFPYDFIIGYYVTDKIGNCA